MSSSRVIFHYFNPESADSPLDIVVFHSPVPSATAVAINQSSKISPVIAENKIKNPLSISSEGMFKAKSKDPIVHKRQQGLSQRDALRLLDELNNNFLINGKYPWYVENVHPLADVYGLFFNPHLSSAKVIEDLWQKHGDKFIVDNDGNHEYRADDKLLKNTRDLLHAYTW
ncbi:MAG: hypothetical protein ACYCQI_01465 [Gammaproteobacteria bacterium]